MQMFLQLLEAPEEVICWRLLQETNSGHSQRRCEGFNQLYSQWVTSKVRGVLGALVLFVKRSETEFFRQLQNETSK